MSYLDHKSKMESVSCLLCKSGLSKIVCTANDLNYHVPGKFVVNKCISCGFCYLSPRFWLENIATAYPERYAKDYLEGLLTDDAMLKGRLSVLRSLTTPGALVLDVGCSYGNFLDLIQRNGYEVIGVEPGDTGREAIKRLPGKIHSTSVADAPIPLESVDMVTLWGVIEHLYSPRQDLEKIYLFMRQGGKILIETPNYDTWESRLFGKFWYALEVPRHVGFFNIKTLKKLLVEVGFEILSSKAESRSVWMDVSYWHFIDAKVNKTNVWGRTLAEKFYNTIGRRLFKLLAVTFCYLGQGGDVVIVAQKPLNKK